MPNWCINRLVITGPVEAMNELRNALHSAYSREYEKESRGTPLTLHALAPMPESVVRENIIHMHGEVQKDDTVKSLHQVLEEEQLTHESGTPVAETLKQLQARGRTVKSLKAYEDADGKLRLITGENDWYDWSFKNWGTKWDAARVETVEDEPGELEFVFDSAWAPPIEALKRAQTLFPRLSFTLRYVESGMGFRGQWSNTERVFEEQLPPSPDIDDEDAWQEYQEAEETGWL